jgi:hypothetical protein
MTEEVFGSMDDRSVLKQGPPSAEQEGLIVLIRAQHHLRSSVFGGCGIGSGG